MPSAPTRPTLKMSLKAAIMPTAAAAKRARPPLPAAA